MDQFELPELGPDFPPIDEIASALQGEIMGIDPRYPVVDGYLGIPIAHQSILGLKA